MDLERAVEVAELDQLEQTWGAVPHRRTSLHVDHPFLSGRQQRLVSDGRRAEICYIMHRGRPADGILLHIKTIYPAGAFRLPTGGIHRQESVMATLAREIHEETGLIVGNRVEDAQVQRFVGILSYDLEHASLGRFSFATYFFLVRMPDGAALSPQDPAEMIGGWQWRPPAELDDVAALLEQVGDRAPDWADWGRYRALSHRFVRRMLEP